jgi:hypothetical protein
MNESQSGTAIVKTFPTTTPAASSILAIRIVIARIAARAMSLTASPPRPGLLSRGHQPWGRLDASLIAFAEP